MIIGVSGYGATGASAYVDLIKEFEGMQFFPASFEFQLLQQPDGICDLKYFLIKSGRRLSIIAELNRFKKNINNSRSYRISKATGGLYEKLTREYFDEIVKLRWNGKSSYDPTDLRYLFDTRKFRVFNSMINRGFQLINPAINWPPLRPQFFSFLDEKEFDQITSEYLKKIFKSCGFDDSRAILVEQLFNSSNPIDGMEFFKDSRALIIDRDPRDVFVISNYALRNLCTFMPHSGKVEDFVEYYSFLHSKKIEDSRVLYLKYEDLIFNYEYTVSKIENFLGIKQVRKMKFFKPQFSINNTQQYLKYPQLKNEFEYIERRLKTLLYPFDEMKNNISFVPIKTDSFDKQDDADKYYKRRKNKDNSSLINGRK